MLGHFSDALESPAVPKGLIAEVQRVIENTHVLEQSQRNTAASMSDALSEVETLRKELEQVRKEYLSDALTGISNRKAADAAMHALIASPREHSTPLYYPAR